jgi:ubiquinone/menaquinone biosynthesis C-methylase UbiE
MILALDVVAGIIALVLLVEGGARLAVALGLRTPVPYVFSGLLTSRMRERTYGSRWTFDAIGLVPGSTVLELGTGPGALTPEAARRVGEGGFVAGLDIQMAMLRDAQTRLTGAGVNNAGLVRADGRRLPFRSGILDAVFLVVVLGEIPDERAAMAEIARVLRPGGFVAVTEILPDPHYHLPGAVMRMMREAGLQPGERDGSLFAYTVKGSKAAGNSES